MTVSATVRQAGPFIGDALTSVFPFGFKCFSKTDLVATLTVIASGVQSTLLVDSDFTVALNADQDATPGGSITYLPGGVAMPATNNLTITSAVPQSQTVTLTIGGGFFPTVISTALDRIVILIQELALKITRGLYVAIGDTVPTALPSAAARALKFLAFDVAGNPTASAGGGSTPVSVAMAPVVAAATTAAAATAMGVATTSYADADAANAKKNYIVNGSLAVNQDVNSTTVDNGYIMDGVRLLLGAANAATAAQDTTDVPTGAGFALKLTVGAGNNNKFGAFWPIENKDILDVRGGVLSLLVPLKATAGLIDGAGKIRIGVLQWTGTADAISATPISAWNGEGVNPTLNAGWTFINAPAAIAVAAAWGDQTVVNVPVAAGATNLGLLIWSDDKANTTATDILRIGGYMTMCKGATAPAAQVAPFDAELKKCQWLFRKTFALATAPAQNVGLNTGEFRWSSVNAAVFFAATMVFPTMRVAPTVTLFNPSAANANARNISLGADCTATAAANANINGVFIGATDNAGGGQGQSIAIHVKLDARL